MHSDWEAQTFILMKAFGELMKRPLLFTNVSESQPAKEDTLKTLNTQSTETLDIGEFYEQNVRSQKT